MKAAPTPPTAATGSISRRAWLSGPAAAVGAGLLLSRSSRSATFAPSDRRHAFTLRVDADGRGVPVNRRVLGSNVGWAFGGDDMVGADGAFAPRLLDMARRLAPTVLRYPGGTYSDVFHWEAERNEHVFNRQLQPTLMDTRRFLELCEAVGAEPLLTVNMVTGTTDEAARWITATNTRGGMTSRLTGRPLPRVRFWELGNEPYLREESRADINPSPEAFARRVDPMIRALRGVDPWVRIGLPLTNDSRAGVPVTPYPGFARTVLGIVGERFDYVCLHNAYMPFAWKRAPDPAALYWGAAAGALTVQADMAAMTRLLAELRPGQALPIAITEYSALFSLGRGDTDRWTTTPAGAIFLADVLRVFAESPSVLMANHWSLSANGLFGMIHGDGHARPAYEVMRLMGEALHGERVATTVQAETVPVDAIGQVASMAAMPLVTALATREADGDDRDRAEGQQRLRVVVINKDPRRAGVGRIELDGRPAQSLRATMSLLSTKGVDDVFDASDTAGVFGRQETTLAVDRGSASAPGPAAAAAAPRSSTVFELPPHSVALLTLVTRPA